MCGDTALYTRKVSVTVCRGSRLEGPDEGAVGNPEQRVARQPLHLRSVHVEASGVRIGGALEGRVDTHPPSGHGWWARGQRKLLEVDGWDVGVRVDLDTATGLVARRHQQRVMSGDRAEPFLFVEEERIVDDDVVFEVPECFVPTDFLCQHTMSGKGKVTAEAPGSVRDEPAVERDRPRPSSGLDRLSRSRRPPDAWSPRERVARDGPSSDGPNVSCRRVMVRAIAFARTSHASRSAPRADEGS